ncbi:alpha/beta hydrolase [Aquamicrobium sp. LC103]|uniref:alpha/beta fold hydrolase n=1 Tax=Aquamicrobium sp. LC103 TaxID=1120658 RepID=UPI00063E82BA|nr:alpha/beta hydrolase [Aquamicrobium sp. LC103]TKT75869.1 alpha/beta hydrolase [Aquamicrobium sp. LC103]
MNATAELFPGFREVTIETSQARLSAVVGGAGKPVLLVHGYPQTKAAWHRVAGTLAERHTVVAVDLPGYGDSKVVGALPEPGSKRWMGAQLHELMTSLGHRRYAVVGHDRGARVAYRMALDMPDVVTALASLAVVPTSDVWSGADKKFGMGAFHWFLMAQPFDLPERLLASDPDYFIDLTLTKMAGELDHLDARALGEYRRAFRDPAVRHAMCEDYRAGAGVDEHLDLEDRGNGRKIGCPVLVLWEEGKTFGGGRVPLDIWKDWAGDVSGRGLEGGHLLAERASDDVLADLVPFLERG